MRKVEVTTEIRTSPAMVISAFTEAKMLHDWWGVERTLIEKRMGGIYTLAWNISEKGLGFISTGTIKEYNPEGVLIIENFVYLNPEKPFLGPMRLTIKSKRKGDVTELFLCQDGYRNSPEWDWYYEAVKHAWPKVVQTLKEYLEKINKY